jgi:hypothetical protein
MFAPSVLDKANPKKIRVQADLRGLTVKNLPGSGQKMAG